MATFVEGRADAGVVQHLVLASGTVLTGHGETIGDIGLTIHSRKAVQAVAGETIFAVVARGTVFTRTRLTLVFFVGTSVVAGIVVAVGQARRWAREFLGFFTIPLEKVKCLLDT